MRSTFLSKIIKCISLLGLGYGLSACVSYGVKMNGDGLVHESLDYQIAYADSATRSFLPKDWEIEQNKSGRKVVPSKEKFSIDLHSQSGKRSSKTIVSRDLTLLHKRTNGQIIVFSRPLQRDVEEKKLESMLNDMATYIAGGYLVYNNGGTRPFVVARSKNYATKIVSIEPYSIDAGEAIVATIEIADSDQLLMDASHRHRKLKLLLIRPEGRRWHHEVLVAGGRQQKVTRTYRALIGIAYEIEPEFFEEYEPVFDEFIERFELRSRA